MVAARRENMSIWFLSRVEIELKVVAIQSCCGALDILDVFGKFPQDFE